MSKNPCFGTLPKRLADLDYSTCSRHDLTVLLVEHMRVNGSSLVTDLVVSEVLKRWRDAIEMNAQPVLHKRLERAKEMLRKLLATLNGNLDELDRAQNGAPHANDRG